MFLFRKNVMSLRLEINAGRIGVQTQDGKEKIENQTEEVDRISSVGRIFLRICSREREDKTALIKNETVIGICACA